MSYIKKYAAFPIHEIYKVYVNEDDDDITYKTGNFIVKECELRKEIKEYYGDGSICKYYAVDFPYEQRLSDHNDYLGKTSKGNYMYVKEVFDTFEDAKEYITYLREKVYDKDRDSDEIFIDAENVVTKNNYIDALEVPEYTDEFYDELEDAVNNTQKDKTRIYLLEIQRKLEEKNIKVYTNNKAQYIRY